ncbi:unnamed protein product, partial [Ranitomeya imitator]
MSRNTVSESVEFVEAFHSYYHKVTLVRIVKFGLVMKKLCIFDSFGTLVFAVFMGIWVTLFLEFWKRRQAELEYEWDTVEFLEQEEQPLPEYEAKCTHVVVNPITQVSVSPNNPMCVTATRYCGVRRVLPVAVWGSTVAQWIALQPCSAGVLGSSSTLDNICKEFQEEHVPYTAFGKCVRMAFCTSAVLFWILLIIASVVGIIVYRLSVFLVFSATLPKHINGTEAIQKYLTPQTATTVTASIISFIIIMLLNMVYEKVAIMITDY